MIERKGSMKGARSARGFGLIEVIIVIIVISILAIIAIGKFIDVAEAAKKASEDYTVGAVQQGIYMYEMGEQVK